MPYGSIHPQLFTIETNTYRWKIMGRNRGRKSSFERNPIQMERNGMGWKEKVQFRENHYTNKGWSDGGRKSRMCQTLSPAVVSLVSQSSACASSMATSMLACTPALCSLARWSAASTLYYQTVNESLYMNEIDYSQVFVQHKLPPSDGIA
jgi:hypothetical protein